MTVNTGSFPAAIEMLEQLVTTLPVRIICHSSRRWSSVISRKETPKVVVRKAIFLIHRTSQLRGSDSSSPETTTETVEPGLAPETCSVVPGHTGLAPETCSAIRAADAGLDDLAPRTQAARRRDL